MWGKSHCFECPTDKYVQILPCKKKRKARLLQYIKNPLPSKNEGPLFTTIVSPNCSHCTYLAHPTKPLAQSRLGVGSSHREYNHCISLWHILTHQMSKSETWKIKTIKKNNKWLIFNHLRIHLTSFHRLVQHPWHLRRVPGWHSLLCSGARKYAKCPKQELLHSRYHASSNCFLWERGWKFTGNKNKRENKQ